MAPCPNWPTVSTRSQEITAARSRSAPRPLTEREGVCGAGFSIIQVRSKAEAIEWASRAPFPEGTQLEIRQVFEDEDFAACDPTGELRAQDEKRRRQYARTA